jgi:hypothetical protein
MTRRLLSSFLLGIRSRRIPRGISTISIVGLALALAAPVVQGATFTCAAGDVQCLIIAINQANTNLQPENTIHLEAGTYTLTNIDNNADGPNGLPSITSTLTIDVAAHKTATITRPANALFFRLLHRGQEALAVVSAADRKVYQTSSLRTRCSISSGCPSMSCD